jgi:hypothetical protein
MKKKSIDLLKSWKGSFKNDKWIDEEISRKKQQSYRKLKRHSNLRIAR